MTKSERSTREWTLASVPRGLLVEVLELPAERPEELLVHGLRPGVRLAVDGDAPFGGPRIIRLAGSRLAIDRRLAATVRVALAAMSVEPR